MMRGKTRSQVMAQEAYSRISRRSSNEGFKEYSAFAKRFPALIHTCGLAQAVAFALAKKRKDYVEDLATVLRACGHESINSADALSDESRNAGLGVYFRLSCDGLDAAGWLKRYVEAYEEED